MTADGINHQTDDLTLRGLRTSLDQTIADAAAAEQAERLRMAGGAPKLEPAPNCVVRNASGQGTHLEYRHPLSLDL